MRKGFTLTLGFTRPVVTWKLVAVPLAFTAVAAAVGYLVPVALLRGLFSVPLPLLSGAALGATASLLTTASGWWTGNARGQRMAAFGLLVIFLLWYWGGGAISEGPATPDFSQVYAYSAATYARLAVTAALACALVVLGVGRQRRGDDLADALARFAPWRRGPGGGGLTDTIRLVLRAGPSWSTSTGALIWFESLTVGAGVLASGVWIAVAVLVILSVAARSGLSDDILVVGAFWALAGPTLAAFRHVLGLDRKQGRVRMSPHLRTRAVGTARLAGIKVLVVTGALVGAWTIAFGAVWLFGTWVGFGGASLRAALADYLPTLSWGLGTAFGLFALIIHGASLLAWAGAIQSLFVIHARRTTLAGLGILAYGTTIVALAVQGSLDAELAFYIHVGALVAGLVALEAYFLSRLVAERILGERAVALVAALGLAFALATQGMTLRFLGVDGAGLDEHAVALFLGLLPLGAVAFMPWAISRLRHE
jgi:hypothetical protein